MCVTTQVFLPQGSQGFEQRNTRSSILFRYLPANYFKRIPCVPCFFLVAFVVKPPE